MPTNLPPARAKGKSLLGSGKADVPQIAVLGHAVGEFLQRRQVFQAQTVGGGLDKALGLQLGELGREQIEAHIQIPGHDATFQRVGNDVRHAAFIAIEMGKRDEQRGNTLNGPGFCMQRRPLRVSKRPRAQAPY